MPRGAKAREVFTKWASEVGLSPSLMYYVYILKLINGQFYTGETGNLRKRVKQHFQSNTKTTTRIKPVELVFYTAFKDENKALAFEKYLKSSSGFAFRNKRLI